MSLLNPLVWFEFNSTSTSAEFGNIWPGRRVQMKKDRTEVYIKAGAGQVVDGNHLADQADAQKRKAGMPGAGNVLHNGDQGGQEHQGKPVSRMNKADLEAEIVRLNGLTDVEAEKITVPEGATVAQLKELVSAKHDEIAEKAGAAE